MDTQQPTNGVEDGIPPSRRRSPLIKNPGDDEDTDVRPLQWTCELSLKMCRCFVMEDLDVTSGADSSASGKVSALVFVRAGVRLVDGRTLAACLQRP